MPYVEESPPRREIVGGQTAVCAFVGTAAEGPCDVATPLSHAGDYERQFGRIPGGSALGYAVRDFFQNGGSSAIVVRTPASVAGSGWLAALDAGPDFNLLCLLPDRTDGDVAPAMLADALACCERRRAMLLMDSPAAWQGEGGVERAIAGAAGLTTSANAAIYTPRLLAFDERRGAVSAIGAVAGVIARTDATRGVWKAPAGVGVDLLGFRPAQALTDAQIGRLNPLGINCIRTSPSGGACVWGARTRAGADIHGSDFKYLPVRRLALYLERSLEQGLAWAVFEPNQPSTWAQVRLMAGDFLHDWFTAGALQGSSPKQAYFVKCDESTCGDGAMDVLVGFAPVRPAEFIVLRVRIAMPA